MKDLKNISDAAMAALKRLTKGIKERKLNIPGVGKAGVHLKNVEATILHVKQTPAYEADPSLRDLVDGVERDIVAFRTSGVPEPRPVIISGGPVNDGEKSEDVVSIDELYTEVEPNIRCWIFEKETDEELRERTKAPDFLEALREEYAAAGRDDPHASDHLSGLVNPSSIALEDYPSHAAWSAAKHRAKLALARATVAA